MALGCLAVYPGRGRPANVLGADGAHAEGLCKINRRRRFVYKLDDRYLGLKKTEKMASQKRKSRRKEGGNQHKIRKLIAIARKLVTANSWVHGTFDF